MAKFCPNCGAKNEDNHKFCVNCGYNIADIKREIQQTETVNLSENNEKEQLERELEKQPEPEYPYIPKTSKNKIDTTTYQQQKYSVYTQTQTKTEPNTTYNINSQSKYYEKEKYDNLPTDLKERIKLWEAYIQKNTEYYIPKFIEFYTTDKNTSWNWVSFFWAPYWMAYRKMMDKGVLVVIPILIPLVNIITLIFTGIFGNYLYYKHVESKIEEAIAKEKTLNISAIDYLQKIGGVDTKGIFIMMGLIFVLNLLVQFLIAAAT